MSVADVFYEMVSKKNLYNITSLDNIPSIISNGILCFNSAKGFMHTSVALLGVQARRDSVIIPSGDRLHDYANLYFTYNNPMLYRIKDDADNLCILAISAEVLNIDGCVVSDRNAATDLVRFFPAEEGIKHLDYGIIYAQYWNQGDYFEQKNRKAIKCAEALIPHSVPFDYVIGAYVVSDEAADKLRAAGFNRRIVVKPSVFYR